jgi:hypothetical protein
MNRYQDIQIELNKSNRRVLKSTFIPVIDRMPGDIYVITDYSDRLDLLANQFYNDITLYWVIAIANYDKLTLGSLFIPEGTQLRIPTNINEILNSYNQLNSL